MNIDKNHYTLLTAICAQLFFTPLMAAGMNAVLPEIGITFNSSASQLSMVGTTYALGMAIFQLAAGSLGDIFGHRRIFLSGSLIFGSASLIAAITSLMPVFLVMRFIQGIGGAMLNASGLALLASCSRPENRPAYLGLSSMSVYSGIAFGPPAAGFIAGTIGWNWLLWINMLSCLVVWGLMKFTASHNWQPAKNEKFDWQGAVLFALSMTGLTICASQLGTSSLLALSAFVLFVIFLIAFVFHEKKFSFPVLNLDMLINNKILSLSAVAAFVNYASFFGLTFYFSFYLQTGKNLSVSQSGLILSLQAIAQVIATKPAAYLCSKWGTNKTSAFGAGMCGAGLLCAAFLAPQTSILVLFSTQILLGAGMSIFSLANTALILESAGPKGIGQGAGLTGAVRNTGQLCSMIVITFSLGFFLGQAPVTNETLPGFMQSMRMDLIFFGLLNLCAIGCAFARKHH